MTLSYESGLDWPLPGGYPVVLYDSSVSRAGLLTSSQSNTGASKTRITPGRFACSEMSQSQPRFKWKGTDVGGGSGVTLQRPRQDGELAVGYLLGESDTHVLALVTTLSEVNGSVSGQRSSVMGGQTGECGGHFLQINGQKNKGGWSRSLWTFIHSITVEHPRVYQRSWGSGGFSCKAWHQQMDGVVVNQDELSLRR